MWIHRQVRAEKRKEVETVDSETHGVKLQIWELRNEVLELKESIEEEKNETEKLMEELGNENVGDDEVEVNDDDDDLWLLSKSQWCSWIYWSFVIIQEKVHLNMHKNKTEFKIKIIQTVQMQDPQLK